MTRTPTLDELRTAPGRLPISVIVTTFNEEVNVGDCIESVLWADEILLVDSFSSDATVEIARRYPIEVLQREYFGSAAQKNWAIDRVKHEWVLPNFPQTIQQPACVLTDAGGIAVQGVGQ